MNVWLTIGRTLNEALNKGKVFVTEHLVHGRVPGREATAGVIESALGGWTPVVDGVVILDDEDKRYLSLALAGMATKMIRRKA